MLGSHFLEWIPSCAYTICTFKFQFLHIYQWITFPTQSCLVLYLFCANLLYSLFTWLIVSSLSPHNLHLLFSCVLSIFAITQLVPRALVCLLLLLLLLLLIIIIIISSAFHPSSSSSSSSSSSDIPPLHMDEQRQDDKLKPTYNSSVPIQHVALDTYREQWTLETGGEWRSGRSMLTGRHDYDDNYSLPSDYYHYCSPFSAFSLLLLLFLSHPSSSSSSSSNYLLL